MATSPCRVLYLVFDGTLGGSLASCADFIRHTDPAAVQVTFGVLGQPGQTSDAIAALGSEVVSFGATSWRDAGAALRFWRYLRRHRFDVVHNNARTYFGHVVLWLAAGRARLIYHEHGDLHTEGNVFACRLFYRLFAWMYPLFLTVGPDTVEAMVREGVDPSRIRDLASPVDLEAYTPALPRSDARRRLGLDPDAVIVGTACRLVHQKDLGLFVDAAAALHRTHPYVHFVIAGEGEDEPWLRQRARALGLDASLHFLGNRGDMPAVWRAFDLFLLTSRQESFGRTILESLASATPIVGVRPEMGGGRIVDAAAGVRIIAGRDPEDLAAAMRPLCEDRALREALGADGRAWTLQQSVFRVEYWARRLRGVYEDVRNGLRVRT